MSLQCSKISVPCTKLSTRYMKKYGIANTYPLEFVAECSTVICYKKILNYSTIGFKTFVDMNSCKLRSKIIIYVINLCHTELLADFVFYKLACVGISFSTIRASVKSLTSIKASRV